MAKSINDLNLPLLRQRLSELIALRKTNALALAKAAGVGNTYVNDILTGKSKRPEVDRLRAVARVLKSNLGYLLGEHDRATADFEERAVTSMPIIGISEAGAFRTMSEYADNEVDLPQLAAAKSRDYPNAKHFALEVRGDSMNAAKKPILEGMFVLCVDMIDAELEIESGKIYVVRRTLDGGQSYETTIKRAKVFRDRVELHPESLNPKHKPTVIKRKRDTMMTSEVLAIGWVYGTFNSFED